MTTTLPPQAPRQQGDAVPPATLASLSTLSTLWVPLDETIGQWATFAQEALTVSALVAVGTAFHGLAWESKALRHYTWAVQERERGRLRKEAHWLGRVVQDLDCAIDQWQQVLSWLDLAGNDDQQQDPASLDTRRGDGPCTNRCSRNSPVPNSRCSGSMLIQTTARRRERSDDDHSHSIPHDCEAGQGCHHWLSPTAGLANRDPHGL